MSEVLGCPAKKFLGKPLLDALPEIRVQGFETRLPEVFTTGKPFEVKEFPATLKRKCIFSLTQPLPPSSLRGHKKNLTKTDEV